MTRSSVQSSKYAKKKTSDQPLFQGSEDARMQNSDLYPRDRQLRRTAHFRNVELVSLNGNVVTGENNTCYHHTHAVFSYKDGERHCMAAGHMKSITVLYTAEIELHPVTGGTIRRKYDPETGTGFWDFKVNQVSPMFQLTKSNKQRADVCKETETGS